MPKRLIRSYATAGSRPYKRRRGVTTAARASAALRMVRQLNGRIERKFLAYAQSANISVTGSVGLLWNTTQGSGESQRIGSSINIEKIVVNHRLYNDTTNVSSVAARIIYFQDLRQDYDSAPSVTSVLEYDGVVTSPYAIGYAGRFKILADDTYVLTPNYSGQQIQKVVHKTINMRGAEQRYDAATDNLVKGGVYRLVVGTNSATYPTGLAGYTTVFFTDM